MNFFFVVRKATTRPKTSAIAADLPDGSFSRRTPGWILDMLPALRKCSTTNASVKVTAKTTKKYLIRGDRLDGRGGGLDTFLNIPRRV